MRSKLTVVAFSILLSTLASAGWIDFFNAPANKSLMGPTSGGAATANWRSLVMADFPAPFTLPAGTSAAPSLSFTGAATTGLFSPGANLLGFSSNGSFAGQLSANQWQFGPAGATGYPTSAPIAVVLQSSNSPQDSLQFEAAGANANRWGYLGMEHNGAADNLTLGLYNNQVIRLLSNGLGGIGNSGGTMSEKWSVTSSDTSVSSTAFANHESAMSIRNFSATAGNNSALYFRDSGQVMSALIGVHDTHTGGGTGHLEGIVNNAGTAGIAFKFLATKQPVFPFFSTAGPLHTDTSGNLTQAPIDLTAEVGASILPIANGGTGVNSAATAPWVEVAGDTMTGVLTMPAGSSAAPAISLNGTGGPYSLANGVGFSAGANYVGKYNYISGSSNSKAQWFMGDNVFTNNSSSPLVLQGANYQLLLKGNTDVTGKTWVLDVDAASGGQFCITNYGAGETGLCSPTTNDYWGAGGIAPTRLGAVSSSSSTTSPWTAGNTRSYLSTKNTDATANNHTGLLAYDNNGVTGGAAWVVETHSASVPVTHFELGVANGAAPVTRFKLLATGQPTFSFFGTAGPVITSSAGVLTSPGWAATIIAGSGISRTDNGDGTVTIAASGTPTAVLATKSSGYTLTATDNVILVNCASACTMTLESAATGGSGTTHIIKNIGTSVVTVATTSSQTIDGETTQTLSTQYQSMSVVSDGSNWYVE